MADNEFFRKLGHEPIDTCAELRKPHKTRRNENGVEARAELAEGRGPTDKPHVRLGHIGPVSLAQRRSQSRRDAYLHETIAAIFASTLAPVSLLEQIADLVVPSMVDGCMIHVFGPDARIHQTVAVHVDPTKQAALRALHYDASVGGKPTLDPQYIAQVGRSHIVYDVCDLLTGEHSSDTVYVEQLNALGIKTCMMFPLIARQHTLAVMTFVVDRTRRHPPHNIAFLKALAQRTALALDNAQLSAAMHEEEHNRDTFLAIASHELNSLITSMVGFTYILQQRWSSKLTLTDQEQEIFDVFERLAERLKELIAALFNALHVEPGKIVLNLRPIDLQPLVRILTYEARLAASHLTITYKGVDDTTIVHGDILYLTQVVTNILQNAIKYSSDGGLIEVETRRLDRQVMVIVTDHGRGISAEALPRIFERYYRGSNAEGVPGFGVGLYMVRDIVERLGGTVTVESIEGRGSRFTLLLPLMD